ncbi:MAG: hypothetical protein KZQ64_12825 [gamma proteobacterium symbiont of Bathyaustriella thionipta]|nr:hypothetical protein [gamma proteobacterium symbiont of Bathyaustriella thionipta]MCU7949529.1 hypothetical protein [gamma proteobacterium symbiont of Bathyaustriella thionipta]MCU7954255.1 hypothetical protein [gamma proteobacterium symbiont of Bathyaustriella thionipta]MCU7956129.1 hypothetical protein [gamma proteobacterium symbiont of Bathyaustriella thionipta]MCU7968730.1 hypothetical protein [gamma proteobacterium symbiont of Bathyaustriella thionipta]
MTTIHQNSPANHHSIDDSAHHSDERGIGSDAHGRQRLNDSAHDANSGTVNISFHAHMRLKAFQDQKTQSPTDAELSSVNRLTAPADSQFDIASEQDANAINNNSERAGISGAGFSEQMMGILSEVENNIVQTSEPGYRYLVNMLNNYQTTVEDPGQLQEIMRKEEFYLNRRKPFMESADFQSYSQVLSQFSNIIERQQYSS